MIKKIGLKIGVFCFSLFIVGMAIADEIHLKDGRIVEVKSYWEEDQFICYQKFGAVIKLPRSKVKEIKTENSHDMESTNEASVNNLSEAYNQLMDDLEEDTRVRHANRLERLEEIEIRIWKDNQWLAKNKPIHEKLDREWNTLRETTKKRDKAYNDLYKKVRNLRSQIYSQEKILKNITRRRDRLLDYLVRENNRVFQKGLNNS
jgi:hypothetical protein